MKKNLGVIPDFDCTKRNMNLWASLRTDGFDINDRETLIDRLTDIQPGMDADVIALIATKLRSNFLFLSLDDDAVIRLACEFEPVEYGPGSAIIEESKRHFGETSKTLSSKASSISRKGSFRFSRNISQNSQERGEEYIYILVEGECVVVKDGKQIKGKYGVIEEGTLFGEGAVISDKSMRSATVVATKPVVVYRLSDKIFRESMGEGEFATLQTRMIDIGKVIDTMSGVDTKLKKGTIIQSYRPSNFWLWKRWQGTVLQYVWHKVLGMMVFTGLFGIIVSFITDDWSGVEENDHQLLQQLDFMRGWQMYVFVPPCAMASLVPIYCSYNQPLFC